MSTAQRVIAKLHQLTAEQQAEVLRLVESLAKRARRDGKRVNPMGLLADLNLRIGPEEIDQARREMWGNFPREDLLE
jgi:hypothetical protein